MRGGRSRSEWVVQEGRRGGETRVLVGSGVVVLVAWCIGAVTLLERLRFRAGRGAKGWHQVGECLASSFSCLLLRGLVRAASACSMAWPGSHPSKHLGGACSCWGARRKGITAQYGMVSASTNANGSPCVHNRELVSAAFPVRSAPTGWRVTR